MTDRPTRYQGLIADSCKKPLLDLGRLGEELPVVLGAEARRVPALVLGAEDDRLVDPEALRELAGALDGADEVLMPGLAHDCMLDTAWENAASRILAFLESL